MALNKGLHILNMFSILNKDIRNTLVGVLGIQLRTLHIIGKKSALRSAVTES